MQTIVMTVGTSLLTNRDSELPEAQRRPWLGQTQIGNLEQALVWMSQMALEQISAETNTLWRLDPQPTDEIILLRSDTESGLECAEVLKAYLEQELIQKKVTIHVIPGINYAVDETSSSLERMADQLKIIIANAPGNVTLAATGGFKAQTMIMAIIGNALGVPVCYVHEAYRSLVYLPYLRISEQHLVQIKRASISDSGRPRSSVINVQDCPEHHRPQSWEKVRKMLQEDLLWVDNVYFDKSAFNAPLNGFKVAQKRMTDGRYKFWLHLYQSQEKRMAVALETTANTPEQCEQAAVELRERLGRLL